MFRTISKTPAGESSPIARLFNPRFSAKSGRSRFAPIIFAICSAIPTVSAGDDRGWEFAPYRIHAQLVLELPGGVAETLANELPGYLTRRADAAFGAAWSFEVELADGQSRRSGLSYLENKPNAAPEELSKDADKFLIVSVRRTADGFLLAAREFDRYVSRWSAVIRRSSRQIDMLPEQLFALIAQSVAPLVRLELDPNDARRVLLQARGKALKRSKASESEIKSGDIFLPVLRRTLRSGELAENGIQVVPWTYIEVSSEENGIWIGQVHSGTRQPFGIRRLGRIEQVAIAVRADPGPTRLQLHSRSNPNKPLIGYEVYSQIPGEESTTQIGSTDRSGFVTVPAGESRVRMLTIKSGTQLLGRLPVVPGAQDIVEVPLPDDEARLTAEARLAALREDLIDVVARRNILMARARHKIEQNELDAAQQLLRTIDQLPGRSQFNLALTTASRVARSDDPQVQRRIDLLFRATQTVMTQYLDASPVNELHNELRQARQRGG